MDILEFLKETGKEWRITTEEGTITITNQDYEGGLLQGWDTSKNRKVWGAGETIQKAWADALEGLWCTWCIYE